MRIQTTMDKENAYWMVSWQHEFYGLPPFTNFILIFFLNLRITCTSHARPMKIDQCSWWSWSLQYTDFGGVWHCLLLLIIRLVIRWHFDPSHYLHLSTAQKVIVFHFVQWVTVLFVWQWIITWAVLCWMNQTFKISVNTTQSNTHFIRVKDTW